MKTLSIKELSVKMPGIQQVTTKDLIKAALDSIPDKGYSYDDLKNRQRIEDAIEKSKGGKVEFEDNDAKNLQAMVKATRWTLRHRDILEFCEQIEKL